MQILTQFIAFCNFGYDLAGLVKISAILTVALILSVVIVGMIMNCIETLQMRILAKILGAKAAYIICNRVTFVGTVVHECSHAMFMVLTGAKITEFSIWDTKGDSLGHVSYYNRGPLILKAFQDSLSACAPVIIGLLFEGLIWYIIMNKELPIWADILLWYTFISIIDHMSMSPQDLKNYFKGIWAIAITVFPIFLGICKLATM